MALPKLTKDEAEELATAIHDKFSQILWGDDEDFDFCCTSDAIAGAVGCVRPAVLSVLGFGETDE